MIWPSVLLTGLAATAAGALAVPAARTWMLGDVRHDWLADELPLDRIEPDGRTVRGKDGALSRVYHLRGISYDALVDQEQISLLVSRSQLLHELGKLGLQVRVFGVKRQRDLSYDATWPSPTLKEIGDAEAAHFRASFYVDWYLMITGRTMKALLDAHVKIDAGAAKYMVEPLTTAGRAATGCPLTGFLNGLVCGDFRVDLPVISKSLSGSLPAANMHFGRMTGTITAHVPGRKVHKVISVSEWPEMSSGHLVTQIMGVQGDIEVVQICDPWDATSAMAMYKRLSASQRSALFGNPQLASEADALVALLANEGTTLFATQAQVIVRADDEAALQACIDEVTKILSDKNVLFAVETEGAPTCWFARIPSLPARMRLQPGSRLLRPLTLRDENIAALWPYHQSAVGMFAGPFGNRPVRYFATRSGQAYAFQFHVSTKKKSRGHFLVFAPTGGGKSTLLMHLLGGLAKFDGIRSYIFDSKEGCRFMVDAFGGIYQGYEDLALNPLDVGPETKSSRQRVDMILRAMVSGVPLDEDDEEALKHAVDLTFKIDPPERTLSTIYGFAFPRRSKIRRAMAKWVIDERGNEGLHAHVFNAERDALGGFLDQSHMVGINMNEALDDSVLGPPVVGHISEAISGVAESGLSKGFVIFIDEAAKLLQNDGFRKLAVTMFREYRKLGGAVGLAFQDPAGLTKSPDADAFIDGAATMIFLPNALASRESLEKFELNEEEIAFVRGGARDGVREALVIKRDAATGYRESAIIDVDLEPLGKDILRLYDNGPDANRHLQDLKKKWGDQWRLHL